VVVGCEGVGVGHPVCFVPWTLAWAGFADFVSLLRERGRGVGGAAGRGRGLLSLAGAGGGRFDKGGLL
jgi:hypothetical protein